MIKVGVMGSAGDTLPEDVRESLRAKAEELGRVIAGRGLALLTGGTTGLPGAAGRAAHEAGGLHVGISPAADAHEHAEVFNYPSDNCALLVFTGFGLKGRNVVLVRSCDVVLFIRGSVGALNEFTIAYDEGKVIGCLAGTGGVADEAARLVRTLAKETRARVLIDEEPSRLLDACLGALAGDAREGGLADGPGT
jgi:uncharacterized protein (TIGR00725 family)